MRRGSWLGRLPNKYLIIAWQTLQAESAPSYVPSDIEICAENTKGTNIILQVCNFMYGGWDLAEGLTANAEVETVLGSIKASSDTVESEGRQMKQQNIEKNPINPLFNFMYLYVFGEQKKFDKQSQGREEGLKQELWLGISQLFFSAKCSI